MTLAHITEHSRSYFHFASPTSLIHLSPSPRLRRARPAFKLLSSVSHRRCPRYCPHRLSWGIDYAFAFIVLFPPSSIFPALPAMPAFPAFSRFPSFTSLLLFLTSSSRFAFRA